MTNGEKLLHGFFRRQGATGLAALGVSAILIGLGMTRKFGELVTTVLAFVTALAIVLTIMCAVTMFVRWLFSEAKP